MSYIKIESTTHAIVSPYSLSETSLIAIPTIESYNEKSFGASMSLLWTTGFSKTVLPSFFQHPTAIASQRFECPDQGHPPPTPKKVEAVSIMEATVFKKILSI